MGHGRRKRHRRGGGLGARRGGRDAGSERTARRAAGERRRPHPRQRRRRACAAGRPDEIRAGAKGRRVHQGHARAAGRAGEQRRGKHPRPALEQADAGGDRRAGARQPVRLALLRDGRAADDAGAEGRRHHQHGLDGRPLHRRLQWADLYRRQARRGGDEPHDQHGGVRQQHPLHRAAARRGGDADPRQAPQPGRAGGARAHGAVGRLRRPHPLYRLPAEPRRHERGDARRRPGTAATSPICSAPSERRDHAEQPQGGPGAADDGQGRTRGPRRVATISRCGPTRPR